MPTCNRLSFSVLGVVLIHASASGQPTASAPPPAVVVRVGGTTFISCEQDPPAEDAYAHCALRFSHHRLLRGTPGTELTRSAFLKPARLSRYVRGDSARLYASRYEHDTYHGPLVVLLGGTAALSQFLVARRVCQDVWCSHDRRKARMRVFEIGGTVVAGFGFKQLLKGVREGNRALWFSNATLPHKSP